MSKPVTLVAFGAGYVLGARAGRQRYEQIADKAQRVWRDPRVQRRAAQVQDVAAQRASQAASAAGHKVVDAASSVKESVQATVEEKTTHRSADSDGASTARPGDGPGEVGPGNIAPTASPVR